MKVLLGRSIVPLLLKRTESGVLTTDSDTATSRPSWVLILNDGTVRVTSTGTVRQPATF